MDGSSKVNGWHHVWNAATLIEKGKNKSAQRAELHALFLAVMGELNNDKSVYVFFFFFN